MVIVESTRSTVPSCRNGIRLSEIASMKFGSTPSLSAIALPKSTSKPSISSVCGFLNPNGGTSYLTPILISPAAWILPIVVSARELLDLGGRRRLRRRSPAPLVVVAASAATNSPSTSASISAQRVVFISRLLQ